MTFTLQYAFNMMRIRRAEFLIAEIPILGIPIALSTSRMVGIELPQLLEFTTLFFLLFNVGDMVNCLCDRDIDVAQKSYLAKAVTELGVGNVLSQIIFTSIAAIVLAIHLSWQLHKPYLTWVTLLALFVAVSYSVPPIRFKNRGHLQILWLLLGLFVLPMLFSCLIVDCTIQPITISIIVSYAIIQTGIVLVNTAEDFLEDRGFGINTAIVSAGLRRGISYAAFMAAFGVITLFPLFALLLNELGGSVWTFIVPIIGLGLCFCTFLKIFRLFQDLQNVDETSGAELVKAQAKMVPIALTSIAWCAFACALQCAILRLGG